MTVFDALVQGAKQEVQHVIDFATTPVGPFETVDKMVKTARGTLRSAASAVGVSLPVRGQIGQIGTRIRRFRRY